MESAYNESMLDFDLSYFDYKNEVQKKPHTKESFLRLKKKIISTDALLQSHKQLKNELMKTRNECKQIRVDHKETTEKLRSVQNENEKLKKNNNETLQKQHYDNLQLQGLQSYIKQLQELVAEKEAKIGSIELEKQLLLSSLQDQKKEHKKSLRSNIKEKNRQSSDTVASFTASDFEIEHAYSIDTGCGSSIASITSPDYSSNNSPISLDCLSFHKSTSVVSVATSPIEFLTSVSESEPKHVVVDTDTYEHVTSTKCSLNIPTEQEPPKIYDDECIRTQSLSRLDKVFETDANESVVSKKDLINVAVQTELVPPKIVSDKYTSTQTLISVTDDDNYVTSKEKNTPVEDMEVQSILHMMTMTFPAISPIPPSPIMLKDASTQCCSNYDINCSRQILPSKSISNDISTNRKKSVSFNYVPLLENNSVDLDSPLKTCLSVFKSNTNQSNRIQTDLLLPKNSSVDLNDELNDCSEKLPSNKHISKGKYINDLKDYKIQNKNHDLGLSERDSDVDDGPNLNEIINTSSSNKTYPGHNDLKQITLSKVNTYLKSYNSNKNVLGKKPEVHSLRTNMIENSQRENTVQSTNTRIDFPPLTSVYVKIKKLCNKDIEKYTLIEPFESNKAVTFVSRDSGDSREEIVKDFDDNLMILPEKTVKSPKATKVLPVSNNSDCVKNKGVLPKGISSVSHKDTILRKKYEDLGLSESDSDLSNSDTIIQELEDFSTDNKSRDLTKSTEVSENHVRVLRSKSRRQSSLISKASNSENQRPVRNLKRKCSIELEFANKRVLRNNRTITDDSGLNTVDRIDHLKKSCVQSVDNPSVSLRKTRKGSLSSKIPTCKRTLRRHKDSENNDMEIKEIQHNALKKINSPKSRYSRSSESECELTRQRVLRSMSSPNGLSCESPDKNLIVTQNSNLQIGNIPYLTRYRLKRLSVENEEVKSLKEITNVSPVILQGSKGELQIPLNIKIAANDIIIPTRTKRISTYFSPTKKPANLSNAQQTLNMKDASIISENIQDDKGKLQSPLKIKMAANDTIVPTRTKRLSTYFSPTKKPANLTNAKQTLHSEDFTIISESIQEDKGDLQSPLKNKTAGNEIIVPMRTKRLSSYFSPTKKPEILSNSRQILHTKDAIMINESIRREPEIDYTNIPTQKKRISTYVRPLKNNDNCNQTEVNNVINAETPKSMWNKRISSHAKVNRSVEINVNYSNCREKEINSAAMESHVQVRHTNVKKCRKSLEDNDSNIDDIPLSMILSYSDLDMFNVNDTLPIPKNVPSTVVNKSRYESTNSFFWQMLEKYCGQHTFKRKSHLLTDAAVNTLCETLEVNIARITELPDGFVLLEMKELANTLCKENRKILVSAILTYLMSPKRQSDTECRKYTPPAPIMSKQEQVLLFVLNYIKVQCQYNIFFDVLKSIEYTLFRLNHTPEFVHVENLSHFYAVICRFVGSVTQLRTFVIDAMYCMSYKAIIVAKQCLNVWMHTLPLAHLRNAKNPLVIGIVYLLHYYKCESNPNMVDDLRITLQKRYFYEMTEWNETKLLQFIRTSIMSIKENPLEINNMRCCLILLAKREGVKWCQKNIIEKMLLPIINNQSTPERVKRFSISLLGPIMKPYPNNMKIHCEIVIDKLISIVNTQSCSHNMEETIFRSLIYLNKHNTHKVARALLSWMPREIVSNDFYSVVADYIKEKTSTMWFKILKQNSDY